MLSSTGFVPLETTPASVLLDNNKSAKTNSNFVSQALSDLLELGLVSEVFSPPTVVNPLSVSFNSEGKGRLILDLRDVKKFVPKARFRMEDWKVFINSAVPDGFLFKFDIKSGNHHIDIANLHQQFLGFSWPLRSCTPRFFCFNVLPFGLSSAPFLFTKLFRPLVRHWRAQGFHIVLYLDDAIDCEKDLPTARFASETVRSDLAKAGVIANSAKSVWGPTQVLQWLGLEWNLVDGSISIPQARLDKLLESLQLFKNMVPSRFLASRGFPTIAYKSSSTVYMRNCKPGSGARVTLAVGSLGWRDRVTQGGEPTFSHVNGFK